MHVVFEATGLSASSALVVCMLEPAGSTSLAEATEGLSVVRGADLLVQVVWAVQEFPGTGSMVGMGFPNLVCSLKTWNSPRFPCQGHLQA